ncbi:MAG: sigma-70 family RNA polymerase sigma factor, partial [Actinomycetales bacterium]|nr:sigma-70 family RNA polymerase sigma factor [Actinomycetales bacterium]
MWRSCLVLSWCRSGGAGVVLRVLILTRAQRTVQKTRGPCTVSHGLVYAPFRGGPVPRSTARIPPNSPHHRFAETGSPKPRAVRNGAAALRARAARTIGVDDPAEYETPEETPDPVVAAFESQLVQRAFTSLPERWQAVLWYSEVEAMKPAAIAPLLGVSPNGVSALLVRAREGLRDAYVAAHVEATD